MDSISLVKKLQISFKNSTLNTDVTEELNKKAKIVPTKTTQNETVTEAFEEANNIDIESRISGGVSLDNLLTDILKGGGKMKGGNVKTEEPSDSSVPELVKEHQSSAINKEEKSEESSTSSSTEDETEEDETEEEEKSEEETEDETEDDASRYQRYMKQLKGGKVNNMKPFKGGSYVPQHKSMIIGGFPYVLKSTTKH